MATTTSLAGDPAEVAALKLLALEGAITGEVKVSCSGLAGQLEASNQTASRRLQALDDGGLVERDVVSDGQWVRLTDDGERALREEYEDYRRIFASPGVVELSGTVTGGMGEGRHYVTLPGYLEQFRERLGYEPFPGTLNVELTPESVRRRTALTSLDAVPIESWEGDDRTYGPAVCYPARIETEAGETYEDGHVIEPERTHHDPDQLEVIAPVELRSVLAIDDGHQLTVVAEED